MPMSQSMSGSGQETIDVAHPCVMRGETPGTCSGARRSTTGGTQANERARGPEAQWVTTLSRNYRSTQIQRYKAPQGDHIMRNRITLVVLAFGAIIGAVIGYVDSRPTWDDTGITAVAIFLSAAILAALRPRFVWLVGFIVGIPVLAFNVAVRGGFGSAGALAIGIVGAGFGRLVGRALDLGGGRRSA